MKMKEKQKKWEYLLTAAGVLLAAAGGCMLVTVSDPHMQKRVEIEQRDERNIAIADKAKGKAFDMMTVVFGALMLVFTLMGMDVVTILLLVFAYLFVHGYAIYCRCRYEREM